MLLTLHFVVRRRGMGRWQRWLQQRRREGNERRCGVEQRRGGRGLRIGGRQAQEDDRHTRVKGAQGADKRDLLRPRGRRQVDHRRPDHVPHGHGGQAHAGEVRARGEGEEPRVVVLVVGSRHEHRGAREGQDGRGGPRLLRDRQEALHHTGRARPSRLRAQHDWRRVAGRHRRARHIGASRRVRDGLRARRSDARARHAGEDGGRALPDRARQQDGRLDGQLGPDALRRDQGEAHALLAQVRLRAQQGHLLHAVLGLHGRLHQGAHRRGHLPLVPRTVLHRVPRVAAHPQSHHKRTRAHAAHRQVQGHGHRGHGQARVGHAAAGRQAVRHAQQDQGRDSQYLLRGGGDRLGHLRRECQDQAQRHRGGGDLQRLGSLRSQGVLPGGACLRRSGRYSRVSVHHLRRLQLHSSHPRRHGRSAAQSKYSAFLFNFIHFCYFVSSSSS